MTENNPISVLAAFNILLEEVKADIDFVKSSGARAFEVGDYDKAKEELERAARVTDFLDKITALQKEYEKLFVCKEDGEDSKPRTKKGRRFGYLPHGKRTPEEDYYVPILESLQEMGGSAQVNDVLDCVLKKMKDKLKDVDYETLSSDPNMPRWRNAAQWARNSMVKEGLLRGDSPRGVWQVSEAGLRFLNDKGDN